MAVEHGEDKDEGSESFSGADLAQELQDTAGQVSNRPYEDVATEHLENVEAEYGVKLPPKIRQALDSNQPHDLANRPLYELAARRYRDLDKLRGEKRMSDPDLNLWADAQNPMRVAEFGDHERRRVAEIQEEYSLHSPDNSGYTLSDEDLSKLPRSMQEILRGQRRDESSKEIVFAAAMKLVGLKEVQQRTGMSDRDLAIWAEASYPMSLATYTPQQKLRLAELRQDYL